MFRKPTVFVLGAGASWHYGFPTGEELVKKAIAKANEIASYFLASANILNRYRPGFVLRAGLEPAYNSQEARDQWNKAREEAEQLATRLKQVNPTVIDYFLEQNADLQDVGRLVIAMVLLDCEIQYAREGNVNRREIIAHQTKVGAAVTAAQVDIRAFNDDWLRFVLYKLTSHCSASCDLANNRVRFVTFNYDLSLEMRLHAGLSNISLFDARDIDNFLSGDRILHVYGKLWEKLDHPRSSELKLAKKFSPNDYETMEACRERFDLAFEASKGIRIIGGPEKERDEAAIALARESIMLAEFVYILGYGFDENNSERLGLGSALSGSPNRNRNVMFTNFMGHNRISNAASRLMLGTQNQFLPPNTPSRINSVFSSEHMRTFHYLWEMSTKNVYDALAEDFESLETQSR